METINNYLNTMFASLPDTAELRTLKEEIRSNMAEKYEELKGEGKSENEAIGMVISEFGNIDELLEEIGLDAVADDESLPVLGETEAESFISSSRHSILLVSIGVMLCILGAALMIFLYQLSSSDIIFSGMSENAKTYLPLLALFLFVVPAVGLFVYAGTSLSKYEFIERGQFHLTGSAKRSLEESYPGAAPLMVFSICLFVASPVFIFLGGAFLGDNGYLYGTCALMVTVAIGVFLLLNTTSKLSAYKQLLKREEYAVSKSDEEDRVIGAVAGLIWPIAAGIYLYLGFIRNLWHPGWVIFPITALLFGGFSALYSALKK